MCLSIFFGMKKTVFSRKCMILFFYKSLSEKNAVLTVSKDGWYSLHDRFYADSGCNECHNTNNKKKERYS